SYIIEEARDLQISQMMLLLELLVIYLACGAPVAVFRLTEQGSRSSHTMPRVAYALFLWPLALLAMRRAGTAVSRRIDRLDELRTDLEQSLFSSRGSKDLFEFREVYDRYTGLVRTSNADISVSTAVLDIARHPSRSLASACLKRRQSQMLIRHRDAARTEFAFLLAHHPSRDAEDIVLQLAFEIDDPVLTLEIARQPKSSISPAKIEV
ncbi:MAG TPA: hypothetical protein VGO43_07435, partial [Pyrinomonadaceae bacterium]|nr:hypothetical protein [Pyrinomonadaceae bacterium]